MTEMQTTKIGADMPKGAQKIVKRFFPKDQRMPISSNPNGTLIFRTDKNALGDYCSFALKPDGTGILKMSDNISTHRQSKKRIFTQVFDFTKSRGKRKVSEEITTVQYKTGLMNNIGEAPIYTSSTKLDYENDIVSKYDMRLRMNDTFVKNDLPDKEGITAADRKEIRDAKRHFPALKNAMAKRIGKFFF